MHIIKIKVAEHAGGVSCLNALPKECYDQELGTVAELIQCAGPNGENGFAMFKITDPDGALASIVDQTLEGSNDVGTFSIQRMSGRQLIAIVRNRTCTIAESISKFGCFMTSSERDDNGDFMCTVVGNEGSIKNMIQHMRNKMFDIEVHASYNMDSSFTLAPMQEKTIKIALENGYYDIPKKTDIRELCRIMNVSRSTFDVNLRIAEKKIITAFFDINENMSEK